jgi:hypothetical protein
VYRKERKQTLQEETMKSREQRENDAWYEFKARLKKVNTYVEAKIVVLNSPKENAPGRRFYSNLGHLLDNFTVPGGSNYEERELYINLFERFGDSEPLKPGVKEKTIAELKRSI